MPEGHGLLQEVFRSTPNPPRPSRVSAGTSLGSPEVFLTQVPSQCPGHC